MPKKSEVAQKLSKSGAPKSLKAKVTALARAPKVLKQGSKDGRPSAYKPEFDEQARKLCLLGATDKELANFFGVVEETVNEWKRAHTNFSVSIRAGKEIADADVAEKLLNRALGYSHPEDDIRVVNGVLTITPTIKHYPPDTPAAIHWLNNRQKTKWRSKVDAEISGPDGGAIKHDVTLTPSEAYLRMIGK